MRAARMAAVVPAPNLPPIKKDLAYCAENSHNATASARQLSVMNAALSTQYKSSWAVYINEPRYPMDPVVARRQLSRLACRPQVGIG